MIERLKKLAEKMDQDVALIWDRDGFWSVVVGSNHYSAFEVDFHEGVEGEGETPEIALTKAEEGLE